tara:strand:- start:205 stop:645 length:441 start_codon:yes stop_codon:yes gene_type:complete
MGVEIRLKSSAKTKKSISTGHFTTKEYDGGDASLIKKYSRIHVTYSIDGLGTSALAVNYKIDGKSQWRSVDPEPTNPHVVHRSGITHFNRTNGLQSTAELVIPGKAKGRGIALRFRLIPVGADNPLDFENFILADITFTFRPIMRK